MMELSELLSHKFAELCTIYHFFSLRKKIGCSLLNVHYLKHRIGINRKQINKKCQTTFKYVR